MRARTEAWLLISVTLVTLSASAAAESAAIPVAPSHVKVCASAKAVCASLEIAPVDTAQGRRGYRWGGEDIEPPSTLLSQLTATVRGQDAFIPLSAFADLGNPRIVELRATRQGFDLIILGGDASASYRAVLVFEGNTLTRRKVQHAEFPNEAWEETRYKFNQEKN